MKMEMRFISTFISNNWLTVKLTVTNSYLTMYIKKMTSVYKMGSNPVEVPKIFRVNLQLL